MNFKNGKRKIGLIALLSCVFTATVAFAAYTGFNYINGTVTVEGSPFKMVYADNNEKPVAETANGTIAAVGHATVNGNPAQSTQVGTAGALADGQILTDLSVSAFDGTSHTISGFTVKLSEVEDTIAYTFKIKNTGGSTAYLGAVDIAKTAMPKDSTNNDVTGLEYMITLTGDAGTCTATSTDGEVVSKEPSSGEYISVATGATVDVTLTVKATDARLFSAWSVPEGGSASDGSYGAEIKLGQITITWSAVDLSQA